MDFLDCGVYRWHNTINDKSYIGSAADMEDRRKRHLWEIRAGRHVNKKLLNAFRKYGEAAFEFEILAHCPEDDLLWQEQLAIDAFDAYRTGYNMCPIAGRPFAGRKHSDETKQLMSGPRGKQSAEWVEKRAATRRGNPLSDKNRQGIVKSWEIRKADGWQPSPEARKIQTEALIRGNKSETKRRIVAGNIRKLNESRTPEFVAWCIAKATATRLGREFDLPRPAVRYTA